MFSHSVRYFIQILIELELHRQIFLDKKITENRPVGTELLQTDRQTDGRDKANSHFSQILSRCLKIRFLP